MSLSPRDASPLTGSVPTVLAGLLHDYCRQQGLVCPLPDYLPHERLPLQDWKNALDQLAIQQPRPALGLALAASVQPAHVGILAYLGLSCATLAEALEQLRRYHRLAYDGSSLSIVQAAEQVQVCWGDDAGLPGQLVDETAIGLFVTLVRRLVAPAALPLLQVSFINPAPADLSPYVGFFGCTVCFGQPQTQVVLAAAGLALPLRQPDPALQRILDQQAQLLLAQLPPHTDPLLQALQQALLQQLGLGTPRLEDVAATLGYSARGLQRQLQQRGRSFGQVLDDVRLMLARHYLAQPALALAEIALLLGYSEQSAFQRAFRQWTGQTPLAWRRQPQRR